MLRHYGMLDGTGDPTRRRGSKGYRIALLAPATGIFNREPDRLRTLIPQGTPLGVITNLYGDVLAERVAAATASSSAALAAVGHRGTVVLLLQRHRADRRQPDFK